MAGCVFIVQGDLRKLACDQWLLPCDLRTGPERDWLGGIPGRPHDFNWPRPPDGWRQEAVGAFEPAHWPLTVPAPWLVNVGAVEGQEIPWYVAGAAEFLARAGEVATRRDPRNRRAKPLLGPAKDIVRELALGLSHEQPPAVFNLAAA